MEERKTRHVTFLPSGAEIDAKRRMTNPETNRPYTFAEIGAQSGVSRQAAWKRWDKWKRRQGEVAATTATRETP